MRSHTPCLKILMLFIAISGAAQLSQGQILQSRLQFVPNAPAELLSSRSAVLFENSWSLDQLIEAQSAFQQIGIDAVLYFDVDKITAGIEYFLSRQIKFLVLLGKSNDEYTCIVTPFNNSDTFVNNQQPAWKVSNSKLYEMLMTVYRDSWLTQKKANFLINDQPEMAIPVPVIVGRRAELYPIDLKIDNLAIQKADDASVQSEVETVLKSIYPYPEKYKFVDSIPENEKDLKKLGVQYVMHYVRCRGKTAKELLGYDVTRGESAYGSVTFPNGVPQVKTIPVQTPVYKFYIKHIESGNTFLGTKWDADESRVQAMKNYIMSFKTEMRLN
jgi:hypothetical protein